MLRGTTQPPLGAVVDLASPYAQGLVARWIWHGSVTAPQDLTPHRGHLISTGTPGPQRASGPAGLAAQWDGTANRYYAVATGDSALLAPLNAAPERVTFLAWVRRSVAGVTHPLFSSVAGPATPRYYFGIGSPAGSNLDKVCFGLPSSGGGGVGVVGTTSLVAARDYQLVATRNGTSGTNVAFYLNGVPDGTASLPGSPTDTGQKSLGQDPRLPSYFNGLIYHMAVYNRVLSAAEVAYLYAHPFADLRRPLSLRVRPAGGQLIAVGQAAETATAQGVTWQRRRLVAQAAETDAAQGVVVALRRLVAPAAETDTAQTVGVPVRRLVARAAETDQAQSVALTLRRLVDQAAETNTAHAVSPALRRLIVQAAETDQAQAVAWQIRRLVAQASEGDTAQAVSPVAPGLIAQAAETDQARVVTVRLARLVDRATEADSAQQIALAVRRLLGAAVETDQARTVTLMLRRLVGQATETDAAQGVVPVAPSLITQAAETDTALPVAARKARVISVAAETDTAQQITLAVRRLIGQAAELEAAQAVAIALRRLVVQAAETNTAQAVAVFIPSGKLAIYATITLEPWIVAASVVLEPWTTASPITLEP